MYIECFGVFHCLLWHWCFWRVQTSYFAEYTSIWVGLMSPRASQVGKNLPANARRHKRPGFDPWVGKIWRRPWQPTPVFWPGESHGQRSLVGHSPRGPTESDTTEWLSTHVSGPASWKPAVQGPAVCLLNTQWMCSEKPKLQDHITPLINSTKQR